MNSKQPWVFWLRISIRKKWFSYWWKTRGANFIDLQLWIFHISIGMPWKKQYVNQMGVSYVRKANDTNKIPFWSIQIGKYT